MSIRKYDPDDIRHTFRFLVDEYGYSITRDEEELHGDRPYAFVIEYAGNRRRVQLVYDYQENFFYFSIIRGLNTRYPNDHDNENILIFLRLFRSFDPTIQMAALQPNHQTAVEAAAMNAKLLRQYAPKILKGEEWI